MDLAQLLHEVVLDVQPAGGVDEHEVQAPGGGGLDGVEGHGGRVGALRLADHLAARARSAQTSSCSTAAARKVSPAARSPCCPAPARWAASLPMVVVFPTPLTPTTRFTQGWVGALRRGRRGPEGHHPFA